MKTFSILSAVTFTAALLALPARADDPAPIKLAPEVQAMLKDLLKEVDVETPEAKPETEPTTPAAKSAPAMPASASKSPLGALSTALRTGSLQSGGLMTSAPLGGQGTTGGTPRLSLADWRLLFPLLSRK